MTTITLSDGLTKREAEALVRKTVLEDAKLRELGGKGNYSRVRFEESFRRGYTIDTRDDVIRYCVIAEVL